LEIFFFLPISFARYIFRHRAVRTSVPLRTYYIITIYIAVYKILKYIHILHSIYRYLYIYTHGCTSCRPNSHVLTYPLTRFWRKPSRRARRTGNIVAPHVLIYILLYLLIYRRECSGFRSRLKHVFASRPWIIVHIIPNNIIIVAVRLAFTSERRAATSEI